MSDLQVEYIQELQERIATLEAELRGVREAAEPFVRWFEDSGNDLLVKITPDMILLPPDTEDYDGGTLTRRHFYELLDALKSTPAPERREEKV